MKLDVKELIAKLTNTPMVVEQGTAGIWTYRKWSNGTAECWGQQTTHPKLTVAYSALYIAASGPVAWTFPSGLFVSPPVVNSSIDLKGGVGGTTESNITASSVQTYMYNATAYDASSRDTIVSLSAKGKWK